MKRAFVFLAGVLLLACAQSQPAVAQQSFVYVQSNQGQPAGTNAVLGFKNNGIGNLSNAAGSPYLTRGTGVFDPTGILNPTDADQQVLVDPTGNFLYAVNGDSNTIAAFSINANGNLTPVPGSPFPSGGINPSSVGIDANLGIMVVVNRDGDPNQPVNRFTPNYATFRVNGDGSLSPTGNSVTLQSLSRPTQALIKSSDDLFFGLQYVTGRLTSYQISPSGALTQVSQLGPPVPGGQPLGEAVHPTQNVLYVNFPVVGLIGVYTFDSAGHLNLVNTVSTPGGNCWATVNATGTRLYIADSGIASVGVYDITNATSPELLQTAALRNATRALNMALDPTGNFLYVLDVLSAKRLHTLSVLSDGTLAETQSSPVTLPVSITAEPVGVAAVLK